MATNAFKGLPLLFRANDACLYYLFHSCIIQHKKTVPFIWPMKRGSPHRLDP